MKAKPVIPRALANQDVEGAIVYHLEQRAALGFIDALEQAYTRHPASGIGRYAHELELPGLLCWPLKRYPIWCSMSNATTTSTYGASCMACGTFPNG